MATQVTATAYLAPVGTTVPDTFLYIPTYVDVHPDGSSSTHQKIILNSVHFQPNLIDEKINRQEDLPDGSVILHASPYSLKITLSGDIVTLKVNAEPPVNFNVTDGKIGLGTHAIEKHPVVLPTNPA